MKLGSDEPKPGWTKRMVTQISRLKIPIMGYNTDMISPQKFPETLSSGI